MNTQLTIQTQNKQITITKDEFKLMKYEEKWKTLESIIVVNQSLLQQLGSTAISNMALMSENNDLKNKNLALNNQVNDLHILLKQFDELKKENEELILKINQLDETIKNQNVRTEKLEKEIETIKLENKKLINNNDNLTTDMNDMKLYVKKMKDKALFEKFMIALQDINSEDKLEIKLGSIIAKKMSNMRNDRIDNCHYLDINDDQQLTNDKRTLLYKKVNNMPKEIKKKFDTAYPKLIDVMLPHIAPIKTTPSQNVIDDVDEWFTD